MMERRMRGTRLMAEDKRAEGAEGLGTKWLAEGDRAEGDKSEGLAEMRRGVCATTAKAQTGWLRVRTRMVRGQMLRGQKD